MPTLHQHLQTILQTPLPRAELLKALLEAGASPRSAHPRWALQAQISRSLAMGTLQVIPDGKIALNPSKPAPPAPLDALYPTQIETFRAYLLSPAPKTFRQIALEALTLLPDTLTRPQLVELLLSHQVCSTSANPYTAIHSQLSALIAANVIRLTPSRHLVPYNHHIIDSR